MNTEIENKFEEINKVLYDRLSKNNGTIYKGGMTTNIDLDLLGKQFLGHKFIGVFPADSDIPFKKEGKSYFILNTDKAGKPGTHWVAGVKSSSNIYIFDSFGRRTSKLLKSFYNKMMLKGFRIYDSDYDPNQKILETDCGTRCISALIIARKYGVKKFLEL